MNAMALSLIYFGICAASLIAGQSTDISFRMFLILGNIWAAAHWLNKQAQERQA